MSQRVVSDLGTGPVRDWLMDPADEQCPVCLTKIESFGRLHELLGFCDRCA